MGSLSLPADVQNRVAASILAGVQTAVTARTCGVSVSSVGRIRRTIEAAGGVWTEADARKPAARPRVAKKPKRAAAPVVEKCPSGHPWTRDTARVDYWENRVYCRECEIAKVRQRLSYHGAVAA